MEPGGTSGQPSVPTRLGLPHAICAHPFQPPHPPPHGVTHITQSPVPATGVGHGVDGSRGAITADVTPPGREARVSLDDGEGTQPFASPGTAIPQFRALEADHDYLLEGGVFTPDLIETWVDYKRVNEVLPISLRPHPHEFELYYDI